MNTSLLSNFLIFCSCFWHGREAGIRSATWKRAFFSPQCHKINVFLRHCENAHWALLFLSQDVPEQCSFLGFSVNKKGSSCFCSYQRCLLSLFLEGYWEEVNEDERFYWGGIWRVADADGDPKDGSLMTLWLSFLNWVCRDAFLQKSIFFKTVYSTSFWTSI